MTIHLRYLGCDISKDTLDIFDPKTSRGFRIANTTEAVSEFAGSLKGQTVMVVLEATGAYDRTLRDGLSKVGVRCRRVNPSRARRYAEVVGHLAKTDAVDARLLSSMGTALNLKADTPDDPVRLELCELRQRRDQLVQMRADEKNRLHTTSPALLASVERHIEVLDGLIAEVEGGIKALIAQHKPLKEEAARLRSAPGVGEVTASVLLSLLPELGHLDGKRIASLVGLAPFNKDSGKYRGKRRIRGGRRRVRKALYMAALGAVKKDRRLRAFYERIVERTNARKVALVAVARKLLTILNAMARDNVAYVPA